MAFLNMTNVMSKPAPGARETFGPAVLGIGHGPRRKIDWAASVLWGEMGRFSMFGTNGLRSSPFAKVPINKIDALRQRLIQPLRLGSVKDTSALMGRFQPSSTGE